MAVKLSSHGKWKLDVCITLPDGRTERVRKVSPIQTKRVELNYTRIEMTMRYAHLAEGIGHDMIDEAPPNSPS